MNKARRISLITSTLIELGKDSKLRVKLEAELKEYIEEREERDGN